jgi:hypothetical protein
LANARTAFDALLAATLANDDVHQAQLNGKRALAFEGEPFLMWHRDAIAVRLHGRALQRARAIEGSVDFDPYNPEEATMTRPGWVRVPPAAFQRWPQLAQDALQCARDARWKNVSWELPAAAAPGDPAATDAAAAKKRADMAKRAQAGVEWGFDFALEPLPA